MNKSEFVGLVQEKGGYKTKVEAENAINSFKDAVIESLVSGDGVSLTGFVSFEKKLQKGKTGKVPGTDKTYTTTDKMVPKVKIGKTLKDVVAGIK
jgi:DNA-binding protein HU-beta